MRYEDYTPNERIIDRVVSLWQNAMRKPKFDNSDLSFGGGMARALAGMLPNNSDDATIPAFGAALKSRLMVHRTEPPCREGAKPYVHWVMNLDVDYDPCAVLREAAKEAGLKTQFPWKTRMRWWTDHIAFSQGYAADDVYHYPLDGDRWLVTTLHGDEISKVIEYVNGGKPSFTVETARLLSTSE